MQLNIANAVWAEQTFAFLPEFLDTLAVNYGAGVSLADFLNKPNEVRVQAVLTGAIIFGLPVVIKALDFEGGNGMAMCVPVWAIGGTLIGMISPGRTFIEPFVASFLVALPVTWLLHAGQTVRTLPSFLYVILAGIGVLFTLIGAYIGERIQLGPPPKTAE